MPDEQEAQVCGGGASRQYSGSSNHTTLSPVYEHRDIRLAHGMARHPDQLPADWDLNNYIAPLLSKFPNVEKVSDSEYRNHKQKVRFTIQNTTDKSVFKSWLETPGLHVIYRGHARYGRGPCFGRGVDTDKSESWGDGSPTATTGTFRIGFPFIGVPAHETVDHGYTAHLVKESEGKPEKDDCHPKLRPFHGSLKALALEAIDPALVSLVSGHASGDKYWTYSSEGAVSVIHKAGWRSTVNAPLDWGSSDVKCRVFCLFGCSSFVHNHPVVRKLAEWKREDNERYAYWMTKPSRSVTVSRWLTNLITYDEENAFQSWRPSLIHAVKRTNQDLAKMGEAFRVI